MIRIPISPKFVETTMRNDAYYEGICAAVSRSSRCMSRSLGAIVVNDDGIILSTGYNSPPEGVRSCETWHLNDTMFNILKERNPDYLDHIGANGHLKDCPRRIMGYKSGDGLQYCPAAHAERNAIDNAANVGVSLKDCILYCNCQVPCGECMKSIIQAGINRLVISKLEFYDILSEYLLNDSTILVREFYSSTWNLYNADYENSLLK
jgi:dCMP deaminase